jgi:2-oxoacid:acceptor oxidoreductase gamma subunit (pyruvate/2-ketoisovalerate family)
MFEVRIHGRGGQGAVIASKILAVALFAEGKYVQAFPKFGVERRCAPVEAYLRFDKEKIYLRNEITAPDIVVVLDASLGAVIDVTSGLKKNNTILINTPKDPSEIAGLSGFKVACVDASGIAVEYGLGSKSAPIVNTAICGAFARATGCVTLDSVKKAVMEEIHIKPENNVKACEDAFNSVLAH